MATTKAYSTQMAVLNLLGLYFGEVMGTVDYETYTAMIRDILDLPEKLEQVLAQADRIREMAKDFAGRDDVFFIGRNLDYALSLEGSLKLKEISYIHSEAYASGELKHGTISLIEEGTPVIALSTYGPLFDKGMSNVVEVQARGARVLALCRRWSLCCCPSWVWHPCSCWRTTSPWSGAATSTSPGTWPKASPWNNIA